jgi:hypothetical protein
MVFVRQLVETKTVEGLYKGTMDEAGQRGMVPAEVPALREVPKVKPAAARRALPPV